MKGKQLSKVKPRFGNVWFEESARANHLFNAMQTHRRNGSTFAEMN